MPKLYLTRAQELAANDLFRINGSVEIDPETSQPIYTFNDGFSDKVVADLIGAPEHKDNVANLRRELWGITRKAKKAPPPEPATLELVVNRLDAIDQMISAHTKDLATQADMIGKDCERLNITVLALSDLCRGLGLNPPDYSKAWEPPKDWPKVVTLPAEQSGWQIAEERKTRR